MKNMRALWFIFFSVTGINNMLACPTCLGRSQIDAKSFKDLYKIEKEHTACTGHHSNKQSHAGEKKEINNETEQVNAKEQS